MDNVKSKIKGFINTLNPMKNKNNKFSWYTFLTKGMTWILTIGAIGMSRKYYQLFINQDDLIY